MEREINIEFKICFICEQKVKDKQPSIFCQNLSNFTNGKTGYYHASCFIREGKQKCKGCKDIKN